MKKAESREPRHPKYNLMQILNVDNAKHKDELVENKIPKFILHVLKRSKKVITTSNKSA